MQSVILGRIEQLRNEPMSLNIDTLLDQVWIGLERSDKEVRRCERINVNRLEPITFNNKLPSPT